MMLLSVPFPARASACNPSIVCSGTQCEMCPGIMEGGTCINGRIPCTPCGDLQTCQQAQALAESRSGATSGASTGAVLKNPLSTDSIPEIVGTVMKAGFGILGSLALLMFTYGGFLWLTSGGSPEMIKKGRNSMIWAAMGIGVVFAAYTIVDFLIGAITSAPK